MATMTIWIKGIGIVYHKGNEWKAVFPFGHGHTVKISADKGPVTELSFPGNSINITNIVNPTLRASAPPSRGDGFHNYLNILDKDSCHEKIDLLHGWHSNAVLLKVPNAQFSYDEMTKSHYLLKDDNGGITRQAAIIGSTAKLIVSADSIKIDTKDAPSPSGKDVFPNPFTHNVDIYIDNTCPRNCAHSGQESDFSMIYSVVEDHYTKPCCYHLEREPGDRPSFWRRLIGWFQGVSNLKIDNNDPEPGYEGLPCNIVVAGDPTNMP